MSARRDNSHAVEFEDPDDRFYVLEGAGKLYERLMKYIRAAPTDFYFSGGVERAVWPASE